MTVEVERQWGNTDVIDLDSESRESGGGIRNGHAKGCMVKPNSANKERESHSQSGIKTNLSAR